MSFVSGAVVSTGGSYAPASGTNTCLVWVNSTTGAGVRTASAQDFGGSSMSEVSLSEFSIDLTGSGDPAINSSYLFNPGTTSNALTLTWTGSVFNQNSYAFTIDNVDSITSEDGDTYTASTNPSLTYNAVSGDTVVYVRHHARGGAATSWTAPTGFTQRANMHLVTSPARRSCAVWTKEVTTTETGATVQATESASGDGVHNVFVVKGATVDTSVNASLETLSITANRSFVLASNIATLTNTVNNYQTVGSVEDFGAGGTNVSSVTYRDETQEVVTIRNGSASMDVYPYSATNDYTVSATKTINLTFDGSDCEGVCDMGQGEFATCSEDGGRYQVNIYDWPNAAGTTATSKQEFTLAANGVDNNSGSEGIAYDRQNSIFYIVGEGEQGSTDREFFKLLRPGVNGRLGDTSTSYAYNDADDGDGWSLDDYISQDWDPEVAFASYGATGATFDLSGLDFDHASGDLLFASDTGQMVLQVNPDDGSVTAERSVSGQTQTEGVCVLPDGRLMIMGEPAQYQVYEVISSTEISATTETLTIGTFNATIEITTIINISATLETLSITTNQATIQALVDNNISATIESLAINTFNSNVENLTNTEISATLEVLNLTTYQAIIQAGVNVNVNATLETISINTFNTNVDALVNTNINTTIESLAITTYNSNVDHSIDIDISATLETLSIIAYNADIELGSSFNISASLEALSIIMHGAQVQALVSVEVSATIETLTINTFNAGISDGKFWQDESLQQANWTIESEAESPPIWTDKAQNNTEWN